MYQAAASLTREAWPRWRVSEHERGSPTEPREDRRRRVEQRPMPDIVMPASHDRRARRPLRSEYAEQPAAIPELAAEAYGHDFRGSIEEDHVIGCALGSPRGRLCGYVCDVREAKVGQNLFAPGRQGGIALGRCYLG